MKLSLIVALVLMGGLVRADPSGKDQARVLLGEGNARFAAGDYEAALRHFRRAYELFPSPKLLANTAACETQLGRDDLAASDLDEFLRRFDQLPAPSDDERRIASDARTELERLRSGLGRIEWLAAPTDGTLEVDGEAGWLVRWVKPGEHKTRIHTGAREQLGTERVEAGKLVTLSLAAGTVLAPVEHRRRPGWVVPVAVVGGVVVVGLALGLGLGLGLRHASALHGDNTVTFSP